MFGLEANFYKCLSGAPSLTLHALQNFVCLFGHGVRASRNICTGHNASNCPGLSGGRPEASWPHQLGALILSPCLLTACTFVVPRRSATDRHRHQHCLATERAVCFTPLSFSLCLFVYSHCSSISIHGIRVGWPSSAQSPSDATLLSLSIA